jgi:hypothetical protein
LLTVQAENRAAPIAVNAGVARTALVDASIQISFAVLNNPTKRIRTVGAALKTIRVRRQLEDSAAATILANIDARRFSFAD